MFLIVTTAFAQELPWECPPISMPADATVYRDTDAGLEDTFHSLHAVAEAYVDEGCAWVETTTVDTTTTTTERVCVTDAGTVTTLEWVGEERYGAEYNGWSGLQIEVVSPVGEPWTRLLVRVSDSTSTSSSWSGGGGDSWRAEWDGAFAGLPDDGWFELASGISYGSPWTVRSRSVQTSGCSWDWGQQGDGEDYSEWVSALGRYVSVYALYRGVCPDAVYLGHVDRVLVGAVDYEAWARDPDDADADGIVAVCDCDDADPGLSPITPEIVNDGIDQDCDGADAVDFDLDEDGYEGSGFGGDDCDDADATVHPAADDLPGDGLDADCDGADDVDADDDGYTVDGDDRAPDCDDTDASVSPTDPEIPYDGIDQDCDGADLTDRDGDGVDGEGAGGADCDDRDPTVAPGLPEVECDGIDQDCDGADACPPPATEASVGAEEEALGCFGGAAWLALLPGGLLVRRRRRGPTP